MANWQWNPSIFGIGGNAILQCEGFSISYNPHPGQGLSIFESDDGGPETALIVNDKFFILNGDWRTQYEELIPKGVEACLQFYRDHADAHRSSWSEPEAA